MVIILQEDYDITFVIYGWCANIAEEIFESLYSIMTAYNQSKYPPLPILK